MVGERKDRWHILISLDVTRDLCINFKQKFKIWFFNLQNTVFSGIIDIINIFDECVCLCVCVYLKEEKIEF